MDGASFVKQLIAENGRLLAKLDADPPVAVSGSPAGLLAALVRMALENEAEAAEIAAAWVSVTPELEAKWVLARHAGDEARHYQLVEAQAHKIGLDLAGFDPLVPPSPVLEFLRALETTPERVAAALVAREAMGRRRNVQFLKFLDALGQWELAAVYRDVINPDEDAHHRAGC